MNSSQKQKRVGIVHVPYHIRGGEDVHVEQLRGCYEALGYKAINFVEHLGSKGDAVSAIGALSSGQPAEWEAILERENIHFLHLHNIHPRLGPAFLRWIAKRALPTLFTVHNHRFFCTNGLALYEGKICKSCRSSASLSRPILLNCNQNLLKSAYHSIALKKIRTNKLLENACLALIAPSAYIASELELSGIKAEKIRILNHGVDTNSVDAIPAAKGADVIFVARLSEEKGVLSLLNTLALLPKNSFLIIGEGPLDEKVKEAAATYSNLRYLAKVSREQMLSEMKASLVACIPSRCEESYSLVTAEALSLGLQVVVANSESLRHFCEKPFSAIPADTENPASMAASITEALSMPRKTFSEIALLREQLGMSTYQKKLQHLLAELGLYQTLK